MNKNGLQKIAQNICVDFDTLLGKGMYGMVYSCTYMTQNWERKDACIKVQLTQRL
jgi:hypothetical protein